MSSNLKSKSPIHALLVDISGTLLIGSSPIPGAAQALATLRAAHIPFRFCSNTSKESSDAVYERMRAAGLDVRREELWTSIGALKAVLKELGLRRPYMLLSKSALEECADVPATEPEEDLGPTLGSNPPPSVPYDAVVVGLAPPLLDYAHLNTAFRILVGENQPREVSMSPHSPELDPKSNTDIQPQPRSARPPLIALHKARCLESPDRALSLGPGPFVHALEDAARTSAIVVGKPTRAFFEAVLNDLDHDLGSATRRRRHDREKDGGSSPARTSDPACWQGIAVIGDDVLADLGEGAIELGLWRVLVKTGKYRPGDEGCKDALRPDQVCASFAEFVEVLVEQRKSSS